MTGLHSPLEKSDATPQRGFKAAQPASDPTNVQGPINWSLRKAANVLISGNFGAVFGSYVFTMIVDGDAETAFVAEGTTFDLRFVSRSPIARRGPLT